MIRITRSEVLRKCIIIFDALKRVDSKGNAGLEPARGAEEEFEMDTAIAAELRKMLREMEAGEKQAKALVVTEEMTQGMADWQRDIMEHGVLVRLDERLDMK